MILDRAGCFETDASMLRLQTGVTMPKSDNKTNPDE